MSQFAFDQMPIQNSRRMKVWEQIAIGFAPSLLAALAVALNPHFPVNSPGQPPLFVVFVFGIACSFRGGFGVAIQFVRSPMRKLWLGLLLTLLFLGINGVALAVASERISLYLD